MSHWLYNRQWHSAQLELNELLEVELPKQPPKPEKDKMVAFQKVSTMYIKYVLAFRKLEECYDQMVHPQKRRLVRHMLEGTIGRILEVKHEMFKLELLEFHYFDDLLTDMKLTPADVELPIPHFFLSENAKELKEREKLLGSILAQMGPQDAVQPSDEIIITTDEAIQLIQTHERARQGRLRARFMRDIRLQAEREKQAELRGQPKVDKAMAALTIQKVWRGFYQRKTVAAMRAEELIFIGMAPPTQTSQKHTASYQAKKTEEKRRGIQEQNEKEYVEALDTVKKRLEDTEGPDMKEQMQDQIRQWFIESRDASGKFPDYPDDEEGGSEAIFKKREEPKVVEEEGGKGKKGKKGKKGEDKKEKGKKGKKGKGDQEEDLGFQLAPSSFVPTLDETSQSYASTWQNRDESVNLLQKHDVELIKDAKRLEIEGEIRKQVDELMREELKNLKLAIERDKGKGKKAKKKGNKAKKGKKGKKGKKEKDLTPDRTIEDLYTELVREGIVVKCPKTRLSEFVGDYSYLATTLRNSHIEPMPSLYDIKRVVTEHCILPMGSQAVHEKTPHIASLMITGPRGVGKKMLMQAICTEVGANLFDLTPANIAEKYPGKAGLNMLLHMVFKVGKAWAPSIVFIGDCEKSWQKKVPKTDKTDPKRVKKVLPKILKTMKPENRVMIVGVTTAPFNAEVKPLCTMYQRIIIVPRPDYASRYVLWHTIIQNHGGPNSISEALDLSSLAKISDGYSPGHMDKAVTTVLSDRRVQQLHRKPLVASEFIAPLSKLDPIYKEEEEEFQTWFDKTPLGKKRKKAAQGDEGDAGGKGKGKGKGKKGKKGR